MPFSFDASSRVFTCRQCGDCCKGFGGTYLNEEDIRAIAAYIGTDTSVFRSAYCALSGHRYLLTQREDGYCVFWDKICTIHPVKPRMCRRWPFIASVLKDVGNWRVMASMCPGIRADAPEDLIKDCVKNALEAETPDGRS